MAAACGQRLQSVAPAPWTVADAALISVIASNYAISLSLPPPHWPDKSAPGHRRWPAKMADNNNAAATATFNDSTPDLSGQVTARPLSALP